MKKQYKDKFYYTIYDNNIVDRLLVLPDFLFEISSYSMANENFRPVFPGQRNSVTS
jgi:hypothetical protein